MAQVIRNAIRASQFAQIIRKFKSLFLKAHQADSHESLKLPIRTNHATKAVSEVPEARKEEVGIGEENCLGKSGESEGGNSKNDAQTLERSSCNLRRWKSSMAALCPGRDWTTYSGGGRRA